MATNQPAMTHTPQNVTYPILCVNCERFLEAWNTLEYQVSVYEGQWVQFGCDSPLPAMLGTCRQVAANRTRARQRADDARRLYLDHLGAAHDR
jgi:hypothetical protein